jgi:hypothetical protein
MRSSTLAHVSGTSPGARGLDNTGTIDIQGGGTQQASLKITSQTAPATWSGTVNVTGDALLEFAGSGGISNASHHDRVWHISKCTVAHGSRKDAPAPKWSGKRPPNKIFYSAKAIS